MAPSVRQLNWPIPYLRPLNGEFVTGEKVDVYGRLAGDTFSINLATGPKAFQGDDIGFHMSCRIKEEQFVLNSLWGGQWGPEERHKMKGKVELKKEEEFHVEIEAKENEFKVSVNGKDLATFKYRSKLGTNKFIYIDGACTLYSVGWKKIPTPYNLDTSLHSGQTIYMSGEVDGFFNKRFALNIMNGNDHVIHINPRFDQKAFVMNDCNAGVWGDEQRGSDWVLEKGQPFDIIIRCMDAYYEIFANGQRMGTFPHRQPLASVNSINIDGDIKLFGFDIAEGI